jgi:hypothetical protein
MQIETGERIANPNYLDIVMEYNGGYSAFDQLINSRMQLSLF